LPVHPAGGTVHLSFSFIHRPPKQAVAQEALGMGSNSSPTPEQAASTAVEQATAASLTPSAFGIGRLRRIPAAGAFGTTNEQLRTWLAANMDAVGEVTGHAWQAAVTDRSAAGSPNALMANAPEGRAVFEADPAESSSESLGRLVTARVESAATFGVWLAAEPRPEHVAAVAWLNASGEAAFYLIQLEAVRIDDSVPAPWMTLIVRPGRDDAEPEPAKAPATVLSSVAALVATPSARPEPAADAQGTDPAADTATTALTGGKSASTSGDTSSDNKHESSTFEELVADTGRRVDDWRRIALGAARAADETSERH
jgi:hypothetical protein